MFVLLKCRSEKGECYEMTTLSGAGDHSAEDKLDVIGEDKGHGEMEGMLTVSGASKGRTSQDHVYVYICHDIENNDASQLHYILD